MIGYVAWQKEDVTFSFRVEENTEDGGRKFAQTLANVCTITHIPDTVMFALELSDHWSNYTLIGFKMKPVWCCTAYEATYLVRSLPS